MAKSTAKTEQASELYIAVCTFATSDEDGRQIVVRDGDRYPGRFAARFPNDFVGADADALEIARARAATRQY